MRVNCQVWLRWDNQWQINTSIYYTRSIYTPAHKTHFGKNSSDRCNEVIPGAGCRYVNPRPPGDNRPHYDISHVFRPVSAVLCYSTRAINH